MKILVTEFRQESNSFNPINADLAFWAQSGIYEGDEARQAWGSKPCAIAGILDVLDRAPEHPEVVVATVMSCQSGGVAEQEVMDYYWERLEQSLRENLPLAAVVVSFHGALMTTQFDDPEGELTRRIREIVGGSCVVSIATDLHGYISKELIENTNLLVGYHTYPHVDYFETGQRAAQLALRALTSASPPVMAWVPIPMMVSAAAYNSLEGPFKDLMDHCDQLMADQTLLDCTIYQMQPWLDIPEPHSCAVAIATDAHTATEQALDLATRLYEARHSFVVNQLSIDEVIDIAEDPSSPKPTILVDAADSCNAGSPGDSMAVARRLLERGSKLRSATVVNDPAAARKAHELGVGATAQFSLGGSLDPAAISIKAEGYVKSLHDGVYIQEGPAGRGYINRMGKTAVLRFGTMDVVVCEWMIGNGDPQLYRAHGIEQTLYDLVVVKANTSFRAGYTKFAGGIFDADTPGAALSDLFKMPFKRLPKNIYPWVDDSAPTLSVTLAPTPG